MVLAAILSEDITDFKEIFLQPIIGSLLYTREAWLLDLLSAFDKGDLNQFVSLRPFWTSQADLRANEIKIRQKINLIQVKILCFLNFYLDRSVIFF